MKKIFSLFLLLLVSVAGSCLYAEQFDSIVGGIRYVFDTEDSSAIVFDNRYNYVNAYYGDIVIPEIVTIGDTATFVVDEIGSSAFYESGITSISIPNSVTTINPWAFAECNMLNKVTLSENLTSLSDWIFFGCSNLVSISIPEGVTYIGNYAFTLCEKLPIIAIPQSVEYIGDSAFAACKKLVSFDIPERVISVGDGVLKDCEKLTYLTISASVISIGDWAFAGCERLLSVTNHALTPQTISADVFEGVDKTACTLYVPAESVELYRNALVWKDFTHIEPIEKTEGMDNVSYKASQTSKLLRDGQLFIRRGDKTYTLTGHEIK